jgi:LysM repeat protein
VVQRGDLLASIARRYTTTNAILALNPQTTDPNRISVGQRIVVPGAVQQL